MSPIAGDETEPQPQPAQDSERSHRRWSDVRAAPPAAAARPGKFSSNFLVDTNSIFVYFTPAY